jgi:hypothetical protein
MRTDSRQVFFDNCNLWLLDESLSFHDYLASDKSLISMPIIKSKEINEPDICGLNVYDNPVLVSDCRQLPLATLVIIEIKRPMRNDASPGDDTDPIRQVLSYLERIRDGRVTTASGRPIPDSQSIPGFCYVVADLTSTIKKCVKDHDLNVTSDKMGYFGYHKSYNTYIEVMSFDRVVSLAKQRNRAFFDKLGFPSK